MTASEKRAARLIYEGTARSQPPTFEDLPRLSCGLGLDILTVMYFRKARDKHFLKSDELGAFFCHTFSNDLVFRKQARRFLMFMFANSARSNFRIPRHN